MQAGEGSPPPGGRASDDPRFPGLADFREQAQLLAEAGADLIALEMIAAEGYGRAALQAAAETGLPVWLGMTPARREDGTLGTPAELGEGGSFEDLLAALASPALAAVTVMHASPEVIPDAIEVTAAALPGRSGPTPKPAAGHHRTGSSTA